VVTEVGSRVPDYAPGDRLAIAPDIHCGVCYFCRRGLYNLCDAPRYLGITPGYAGGLADKMLLTHEALTRGIVHRIPDGLDYIEAALSEPCSSVLATHHKAGTSLQDVVVVIGAGPTGCMHICIAQARGARVVVSQRSAPRREMARRFGPQAVVDPRSEDLYAVVAGLSEGRGADLVICANPVAATQALAVELARKGGRVVLFGGLPKANPMTTLDSNRIHYGEIEVVGAFSYHPTFHRLALDVLARKIVPADLIVTHTFSLEQVTEAFETAASGKGLKVVVTA
jgi:L-iditol 2-dehydrogenase